MIVIAIQPLFVGNSFRNIKARMTICGSIVLLIMVLSTALRCLRLKFHSVNAVLYLNAAKLRGVIPSKPNLIITHEDDHSIVTKKAVSTDSKCSFNYFHLVG